MLRNPALQKLMLVVLFMATVSAGWITGELIKAITLTVDLPFNVQDETEAAVWKMIVPVICLVVLTNWLGRTSKQFRFRTVVTTFTGVAAIPASALLFQNALIIFFSGLPADFRAFVLGFLWEVA